MGYSVNGIEITAAEFGFDGCHKIYLIENDEERDELRELEYEILPIAMLPQVWADSCPLRFILSADLETSYVRQGEPAFFEGFDFESSLLRELHELALEQLDANGAIDESELVDRWDDPTDYLDGWKRWGELVS